MQTPCQRYHQKHVWTFTCWVPLILVSASAMSLLGYINFVNSGATVRAGHTDVSRVDADSIAVPLDRICVSPALASIIQAAAPNYIRCHL